MVMDPDDKQRHKPSPKHTLDEVRKSLEDMVRNEFDDVAPAAHPHHVEGGESASAPDGSTAGATSHAHEPLQSLPRRKPVGIDTEQLLRSLKGLISHELAEAGDATGDTQETGTGNKAEAAPPPLETAPMQKSPAEDVATEKPVTGVPDDDEDLKSVAPEEVEDITLDTISEDDVPEVDLSSEFESEADLLELEAMAEALAEETEPPAPLATEVEAPNAEPETVETAPAVTVEQGTTPTVKPLSSPLPSLRVVDLSDATGPLRAFAVYDPALGAQPDISEPPVTEPPATAGTVGEPALFVSQWLDELSRQPSHSELGLLETEKRTPPPRKPTTPDAEDEQTIDLLAVTAAPKDIGDDVDLMDTGVVDPQYKPKAEKGQTSKSVLPTPPWTDLDTLEIPGGEPYTADVSKMTSQSDADADGDTGAQLALDIPEKIEESAKSEPRFDDTSRVEEEHAPAQGDASVELEPGVNDTTGDGLHTDETEPAEKEKTPLALANDRKSARAEPATESSPGKQAASGVAIEEQETINIPSVDSGGDAAVKAEESATTGDESIEPQAPLDPELDLAGSSVAERSQTSTELSLADGPLLGPSSGPAFEDSTTIDLGEQAPETREELSTPATRESRVPPPAAKEKTPSRTGREERAPPTGGGIIARRRQTPDTTSRAAKDKEALERHKLPHEIKTNKAPSPPKPRTTPLTVSDEPTPAPKLGPAVFKLSDEPPPPSKEARTAPTVPTVKAKVPASPSVAKPSAETKRSVTPPLASKSGPRSDKPPQEIRADKTPPLPKSGPTTFALRDEPTPAPKLGPAVFKLSDEPPPPSKEARTAPTVKEKAPADVGGQRRVGLPGSTHKPITATPKSRGGTPAVEHRAPAPGKGDDIPVLKNAVAPTDRPSAKPTAPLRSKAVEVAKAERPAVKEAPGSRNLAVQVVAKLNTELRKCGERALSPATVDRLQYLLREVLERSSAVVDNSHKKR